MLYKTRSGSAPTRDPEGKVLTNHAACDGVLEIPTMTKFQSNSFVFTSTSFVKLNIKNINNSNVDCCFMGVKLGPLL